MSSRWWSLKDKAKVVPAGGHMEDSVVKQLQHGGCGAEEGGCGGRDTLDFTESCLQYTDVCLHKHMSCT